jgi:hypothetical protein
VLKLRVSSVDLCVIKTTGSGQRAFWSGFIVCKPDFTNNGRALTIH